MVKHTIIYFGVNYVQETTVDLEAIQVYKTAFWPAYSECSSMNTSKVCISEIF